MTCFVVWTNGAYTWNIDLVESTESAAKRHRLDLIKNHGFESSEVKVTSHGDERVAYAAQDISADHESWSLARCIKAAESV